MLVAVSGLLLVVIAGVAAIVHRRWARPAQVQPAARPAEAPIAAPVRAPAPPRPRPAVVSQAIARGLSGGGGALAVASSSALACPTCRSEYRGMTYCTRDARRLVPVEDLAGGRASARGHGLVCMACRRAYEPGLRSCPHDGSELVPLAVYAAIHPGTRDAGKPVGVIARICPVCGTKYDLGARFCGHDAGELVVIN
jgi:hypothetical protein